MGRGSRGAGSRKTVSRRQLLVGLGAAAGSAVVATGSGTQVTGGRALSIGVADDPNAILGIEGQGPVKKNDREAMVKLSNDTGEELSITVSLVSCGDGALYNNEGDSGCSVTFTLQDGNEQFVDIEAAVTGTIDYTISATSTTGSGLSIETSETVEAESGKVKGAIVIQKPVDDNDFTATVGSNNNSGSFTADKVDIKDEDGDDDLREIRFRVREGGSSGTVVGSLDVTPPGDRYQKNNGVDIPVESDYTVKSGTTYALTVTAEDADDNTESETVEDTT